MAWLSRWGWTAAIVAALVGSGAAIARAQIRNGPVNRVIIDAESLPIPVLARAEAPVQRGGIYEIYFAAPTMLPTLGMREKAYVHVQDIRPDGWLRVQYSDEVENQGEPRAALLNPAILDLGGQVPPVPIELTLSARSIAAISAKLNSDDQMARYWPAF